MSCNLIQTVVNAVAAVTAKTVLLLHLNGNNTDATGKTMTTVGTIGWSSARASPDGTQELLLTTAANCGIQAAASNDFAFGTGDFTVECWFVNTNATTVGPRALVNAGGVTIGFDPSTIASFVSINNTLYKGASNSSPLGARTHLAYSRVNGVGRLYANGTQVVGIVDTTNYTGTNCSVGMSGGGATYWYGFIDEVRVTNGKGRYTSNFTPALETFTTDV